MPESAVILMTVAIHLIVPFRRRALGTIINSVKNIVDSTLLGVVGATVSNVTVALAVNDYTGSVTQCPTGSVIKSVYLFVQIISATGTANVDWYIWKGPNALAAGMPVPGATGGDESRKYILHEEKGIPGNAADGAYPLTFKGVVRIPRGKQRMAENDQIQIKLVGVDTHNICLKVIYKFYT